MQALAFDFDGLILDTETPEFDVWKSVFEENGVSMPEGYWTQVIGRGADQEIERPPQLLARLTGSVVESPERLMERRVRIIARIEEQSMRPGVESLLKEAKREGVPVGIASSSKHVWVDHYLIKLGIFDEFDQIVCADDVTRAKPFPDLYLELCRRLSVSPAEVVALEDSPNGIAAARAAGIFVIAVPNSVTAHLDLGAANCRLDSLEGITLAAIRNTALESTHA